MTMELKIREILKATEWNQQKLAEHFGVSQSTVNRWLSGSQPEGHRRDAINEAFDKFVGNPKPSEGTQSDWREDIQTGADKAVKENVPTLEIKEAMEAALGRAFRLLLPQSIEKTPGALEETREEGRQLRQSRGTPDTDRKHGS